LGKSKQYQDFARYPLSSRLGKNCWRYCESVSNRIIDNPHIYAKLREKPRTTGKTLGFRPKPRKGTSPLDPFYIFLFSPNGCEKSIEQEILLLLISASLQSV
jgi:hypothetical protein